MKTGSSWLPLMEGGLLAGVETPLETPFRVSTVVVLPMVFETEGSLASRSMWSLVSGPVFDAISAGQGAENGTSYGMVGALERGATTAAAVAMLAARGY